MILIDINDSDLNISDSLIYHSNISNTNSISVRSSVLTFTNATFHHIDEHISVIDS